MIDLKKLEANFNSLIEKETEESFNQWLNDKLQKELLGKGEFDCLSTQSFLSTQIITKAIIEIVNPIDAQISGNTQYAMAA